MFTRDPRASYMMPPHFGPRYIGRKSSGWYRDVTVMAISYVTDREKLAAYLPEKFTVADPATVTVYYACNKQVDWLAGHGYNMVGVNCNVIFDGEDGPIEGTYALVIWENLTDPILTGRELQGIPKVYADIPDHSIIGDVWRCNASHFGHKIIDMDIRDLCAPTLDEVAAAQKAQEGKDNPMAWKYIQQSGSFEPCVDEYNTFPSENKVKQVLVGEGRLNWNTLSWEDNPTQYHIVNAMAALPVLQYLPAIVTKGSVNLVLPDRPTRVIK